MQYKEIKMAAKKKHNERSKRSSHNRIPTEMFASRARWKKIQREQIKMAKESV